MRLGIVSIIPKIVNPLAQSFGDLYAAVGLNTGNFMFTQAMFRNLGGEVVYLGFHFDPKEVNEQFTHLVIPAANWLNDQTDWAWFCDKLEKVDIPIVTIGIGVQSDSMELSCVNVTPSALRLAKLLGQKATTISTRGTFTRDWLNSVGVTNAVVTGCPSLYMSVLNPADCSDGGGEGLVVQSTRYGISTNFVSTPSLNRDLFSYAARNDTWIVYQSEAEEIEYLVYGDDIPILHDNHRANVLATLYGFSDSTQLTNYLDRRGRVFFDLEAWAGFLVKRSGQIGTRLHGTILALNHGVPSFLFGHDSRTRELIEFADIPSITQDELSLDINLHFLKENSRGYAAVQQFHQKKIHNLKIYQNFLESNGITYKENLNLLF